MKIIRSLSHRKLISKIAFPTLLLLIIQDGYGQNIIYDKHPNLQLTIGQGMDIRTLNSKIKSPLKSVVLKNENEVGVASTTFFEDLILDESELESSYQLNAEVKARYLTFSASAAYNVNKSSLLNKQSLTLVVSAQSVYGNDILDPNNIELSDNAKKLIADGQYQSFINQYGNYICNGVEKSSRFNVYLTISNITQVEKENVIKSVRGGGALGSFSGSGSVTINNALTKAINNNSVKILIISNGNKEGINGLYPIVTASLNRQNPIDAIVAEITNYMKGFNRENSYISKYYLVSASSFGIPSKYIGWNQVVESAYLSLYNFKKKNDERLDSYQKLYDDKTFKLLSDDKDRSAINSQIRKNTKINNDIFLKSYALNQLTDINKIQAIIDWTGTDIEPSNNIKSTFLKYNNIITKLKAINDGFIHLYPNEPYLLINLNDFPGLLNKKVHMRITGNNQLGPDLNTAFLPDMQYFYGMPINIVVISKNADMQREDKVIDIKLSDPTKNSSKDLIETTMQINNRDRLSYWTNIQASFLDQRLMPPIPLYQDSHGGYIYNNYTTYESQPFLVKSKQVEIYLIYRPEQHYPEADAFTKQNMSPNKLALTFLPYIQLDLSEN